MQKKFVASSIRLTRFLYALGFDKSSIVDCAGAESWEFEHDELLQDALDFYFLMRRKIRSECNAKEINKTNSTR